MSAQRKLDDHAGWYDLGMKLHWGRQYDAFRASVVGQFGSFEGKTILDYGCGTGLLLQYIKAHFRYDGMYIACDPGPNMLAVVREKNIDHKNLVLKLIPEDPALDISAASVDIAVSSLVTHQLPSQGKKKMFAEIFRVLKPGGLFVLAEFGPSSGFMGRMGEFYLRHVWGKIVPTVEEYSRDNFSGALPGFLSGAGFSPVSIVGRHKGTVDIIRAQKP